MWETILSIIVKYWVEFLLGLIVAGGSLFVKRYVKLEKAERQRAQDEHYERLAKDIKKNNEGLIQHFSAKYQDGLDLIDDQYKEITEKVREAMILGKEESQADDAKLEERINTVEDGMGLLKSGILSLQGNMFKDKCRELLKEDHVITLDEWEEVDAEHDVYNALGGNHNGDHLYQLVSEKVKKTLIE